jgi:uncharacterized protein YecT (DUF1311 family)
MPASENIDINPPLTYGASGDSSLVLAAEDAQLNSIYSQLRNRLNAAGRSRLKQDEVEWLRSRDAIADPAAKAAFIDARLKVLSAVLSSLPR